jgi:predicted O-methyltransferase YrrM
LYTIEGGKELAERARVTLDNLNISNVEISVGPFDKVLIDLLPRLAMLDFAFIDGHHNGPATIEYFEMTKPFLRNGSIMVFDDLSWSSEMRNAWNQIKNDSHIDYSIDLFTIGICVAA